MTEENKKSELVKQDETREFIDIMQRINWDNPKPVDLQKAENLIDNNPDLWRLGEGLAGSELYSFITKMNPAKIQQKMLLNEAKSIKTELGYITSNTLERLIIEQILMCWASIYYMEGKISAIMMGGGYNKESGEYWQNTLTCYQKRYLKAIETLARVRKLNSSIALQLNIATDGGQQLNVNKLEKDTVKPND